MVKGKPDKITTILEDRKTSSGQEFFRHTPIFDMQLIRFV